MVSLLQYVRNYYATAFNWLFFFCLTLGLGFLIYINYRHNLNADLVAYEAGWRKFTGFYLLYWAPFATAFLLQFLFFRNLTYFKNHWLWIILFAAPAFFAFKMTVPLTAVFPGNGVYKNEAYFRSTCLGWLWDALIMIIPVAITWYLKDRQQQPLYGTAVPGKLGIYFILLLLMIPLIITAANQPSFLEMYPRSACIKDMHISQGSWRYLLYELCYGINFIGIEFFFRGFLVLGLVRICGQHSILPMACFYCTIHFGKPLAETISSFGGGLLLGIISYHTRSIWGGIIVHLGIAWMMELAGVWLLLS